MYLLQPQPRQHIPGIHRSLFWNENLSRTSLLNFAPFTLKAMLCSILVYHSGFVLLWSTTFELVAFWNNWTIHGEFCSLILHWVVELHFHSLQENKNILSLYISYNDQVLLTYFLNWRVSLEGDGQWEKFKDTILEEYFSLY